MKALISRGFRLFFLLALIGIPGLMSFNRDVPTADSLGGAPLNLIGSPMVTLSGPQSAHFYVSQQPTSPIPAYGTTMFKLRTVRDALPGFLPVGWTYPISFTVNVPNDDSDENPYDFTINFTIEKDS